MNRREWILRGLYGPRSRFLRSLVRRTFFGVLGLAFIMLTGVLLLWLLVTKPLPRDMERFYGVFWSDRDATELKHLKSSLQRPGELPPGELHLKLGNLFYRRGLIPHARRHYIHVLEYQPGRPAAVFNIARTHEREHDYQLALQYYEKAVELEPEDHRAYHEIGRICLDRLDRIACAIGAFKRVLEIEPKHLKARFALGRAYYRAGEYSDAGAQWEVVLKQHPRHRDVRWNRAGLFWQVGQNADALREYKEYRKQGGDSTVLLMRMARLSSWLEKKDEALEYYFEASALSPYDAEPYYRRGQIYFADDRPDLARTLFGKACLRGGVDACRDLVWSTVAPDSFRAKFGQKPAQVARPRPHPFGAAWNPPPGAVGEKLFSVGSVTATRGDFKRMRLLSNYYKQRDGLVNDLTVEPFDLLQERGIVEHECKNRNCLRPLDTRRSCALWPVAVPCIKNAPPDYTSREYRFTAMRSALIARLFRKQIEWQVTEAELAEYFQKGMHDFGQFRGTAEVVSIPVATVRADQQFARIREFEKEALQNPELLKQARERFPNAVYTLKQNLISSRRHARSIPYLFHTMPAGVARLDRMNGNYILIRVIRREPRWNYQTPAWQAAGRRLIREQRSADLYQEWLKRQRVRYPVLMIGAGARI